MRSGAQTAPRTATKFSAQYHNCLQAQKRAIMAALRNPPEIDMEGDHDERPCANELAYSDLCDLLTGSTVRGEGNSCLLIGPRGSGKTRVC
jgi:origin recognition complex subunit 4